MLKKQIRLNRENEGRHKAEELNNLSAQLQQAGTAALQNDREIAASALVGVGGLIVGDNTLALDNVLSLPVTSSSGTRRGKRSADALAPAVTPAEKGRRGRRKTPIGGDEHKEQQENDDDVDDMVEDNYSDGQSDGDDSDNHIDHAALPAISAEALEEEGQQYHLIRPLLSLSQYAHLSRTKSRPKLRCGMKDCRRHTSYYCVKCTRDLQIQSSSGKAKVYALCSPMVENNFFCFYRHSLGLGERDKATAEGLKALDSQKPKKYVFHNNRGSKKGIHAVSVNVGPSDPTTMPHVLLSMTSGNTMPASIPAGVVDSAADGNPSSDDDSNI